MVSDKFRRQLQREAELWRAEGLITNSQYQQLLERYQINTLDTSARNNFIAILIGLGSILIGLGVIIFVAANWQELPRVGKVILLIGLFIGVNIVGFSKWNSQGAQKRIGHGLLLLGALILGANMGLMGQMFHISGSFYELSFAWGIAVLAMSYSLRLTSMGVLSIIIIGLAYWSVWALVENSWSTSSIEYFSWATLMGQHMPLLAGLMFIPLAYWCRSRWIFALGAIAIVSSLEANLSFFFDFAPSVLAIAVALPPALLWGYDDTPWHLNRQPMGVRRRSFQPIARQITLFCLGVSFYLLSFYWFWESFFPTRVVTPSRLTWVALLDALIFIGLALFEWMRLARLVRDRHDNLTTIVIGVFIAIAALVTFWHTSITQIPIQATFIFNVLLFLLAAGLIREGLAQGKRRAFWGGMVLLVLRILGWFLLSNTQLLFKSLMFILCGVGVIAVGLWFERYIANLNDS